MLTDLSRWMPEVWRYFGLVNSVDQNLLKLEVAAQRELKVAEFRRLVTDVVGREGRALTIDILTLGRNRTAKEIGGIANKLNNAYNRLKELIT